LAFATLIPPTAIEAAMLKFRLLAAVCALALSAAALAHDKKDAVDYRQSLMTLIGWNFGPLGNMVKGKAPFDTAEFSKRAGRVAAMSDQIVEGFPKDTLRKESHAKPDIWANWDDFQSKAKELDTQAKLLAEVAKANDEAKDKEQFKKVAAACKACHDKYTHD
jgi:cytochrome c556